MRLIFQHRILMITTPIRVLGESIGVLAELYFAKDELSQITSLGRIGSSGETYLFDRNGIMNSDSRFNTTLEKLGLLNPGQSAVSNVRLYDPGINLMYNTSAERSMTALTLMARSATAGESSKNVSGYRDYRGVPVIGAWRWSPELNMGITTEIDLEEALSSYYSARFIIIALLSLCLFLLLILATSLYHMVKRANTELREAALNLESQVKERTQQLEKAMHDLYQEQAVLQGLFDAIPDPIFCKDAQKRYIKGNKAFFEAFNKSSDQVIGMTDAQIAHEKDQIFFDQTDDEVLATGKPLVIERATHQENNPEAVFETKKSLLRFANNEAPGILGISRDITQMKKNKEKLIQTSLEAQAANKAKSEFLARMSHEIRTPMNGVLGMLDLVMNSSLNADQVNKLNVAKSSARSLLGIINDILDFSRVEAGKLELEQLDFNLQTLLEDSAKALAIKAEAKGIELLVDVTRVEQLMVKGDPMRIRQVITNLLNNAIKFTKEGQVLLSAESYLQDDLSGSPKVQFVCKVTDSGIGIPKDKIGNLFESFSQVDSSTTRLYGGSGLGLAISKRLLDLMKGEINAQSTLGKGSCFTFEVGLIKSSLKPKSLPDLDISNWRVLIVDDNPTNLDILSSQLLNIGVSCSTAIDAASGLSMIKQSDTQFDLVITDMNMPNMDGLSFTKLLRQQVPYGKQLKVLMLSSISFNVSSSELNALGLDGCLLKPVATVDLFNTIKLVASADTHDGEAQAITEQSLLGLNPNSSDDGYRWPSYHRVLVVEDNPINQLVAQGLMQQYRLNYDLAEDGEVALNMLRDSDAEQPFTLILMDCQMPVLDGYSATKKIRLSEAGARYSDIPIVAMTANALKGDREKCIAAGMNDYVAKPIDSGHLMNALQKGFSLCPSHLLQHATNYVHTEHIHYPHTKALILPTAPLKSMDWQHKAPSLSLSPDIYIQSLSLFNEQNSQLSFPDNPQAMHDFKAYLHTLKGSSGNLGFEMLFACCQALEDKIEQNTITHSDIEQLNSRIEDSVDDARALIEANAAFDINARTSEEKGEEARALNEIYADIEKYAKNREFVPYALVNELKAMAIKHPNEQKLSEVIKALDHFDYDNLSNILAGP